LHKLGAAYSERPDDAYWRDVCAGARRVNDRAKQEGALPWVGLRRLPGNGGQAYAGQRLHALLAEGVYERSGHGRRVSGAEAKIRELMLVASDGPMRPSPKTPLMRREVLQDADF